MRRTGTNELINSFEKIVSEEQPGDLKLGATKDKAWGV